MWKKIGDVDRRHHATDRRVFFGHPTPCGDVINCNVRIARAERLDPEM